MKLISCSAVCNCWAVVCKLERSEKVITLTDSGLKCVTCVPYSAVIFSVFGRCKNTWGLCNFNSCFFAQAKGCCIFVNFGNSKPHSAVVEENVARITKCGFYIFTAVCISVKTFEFLLSVFHCTSAVKNRVSADSALFKRSTCNNRFKCRTRSVSTHGKSWPKRVTRVRNKLVIFIVIIV